MIRRISPDFGIETINGLAHFIPLPRGGHDSGGFLYDLDAVKPFVWDEDPIPILGSDYTMWIYKSGKVEIKRNKVSR